MNLSVALQKPDSGLRHCMEALRADLDDVKMALAAAEVREVIFFFVEIRHEDDLRVSIAIGVPQNGWFLMENFRKMDDN